MSRNFFDDDVEAFENEEPIREVSQRGTKDEDDGSRHLVEPIRDDTLNGWRLIDALTGFELYGCASKDWEWAQERAELATQLSRRPVDSLFELKMRADRDVDDRALSVLLRKVLRMKQSSLHEKPKAAPKDLKSFQESLWNI